MFILATYILLFKNRTYVFALAGLVKTLCRKIRLRRENVKRQECGHGCGLFPLANLVEVLDGGDLRKCIFDKQKMRKHLFNASVENIPKAAPDSTES